MSNKIATSIFHSSTALTYMATIADVVRERELEEYALPDWEVRLALRPLYVTPAIFDKVDSSPAFYDGSIIKGARTPGEHLEQFFNDLRCSARPSVSDFKRLQPTSAGVWKCHPPTLRVFGWMTAPDVFVAVSVELEKVLKATSGLYGVHMKGVVQFAAKQGLSSTILKGDHLAVFSRPKG